MEVSRLGCEWGIDIRMCVHPDHTEVWALSCMATNGTKRQAGEVTEQIFTQVGKIYIPS